MKKLLQRSKQKEPTPSNGSLAADLDDASDVESISGGDDDDEDANGALELVSPTETSCSVVDLQPQAVFSDRVLSVAKSEGIDNVIKPISASSAPNLVESVPGTNQPAVEGASFTVLDEVELTCDTVSLSSEMLIVNPDSFPRVVEPMCDTVSLLSEMLIANPDSCPIVENWTDNAELLQKNKSAWLTIQRLKSSKSIKLQVNWCFWFILFLIILCV